MKEREKKKTKNKIIDKREKLCEKNFYIAKF